MSNEENKEKLTPGTWGYGIARSLGYEGEGALSKISRAFRNLRVSLSTWKRESELAQQRENRMQIRSDTNYFTKDRVTYAYDYRDNDGVGAHGGDSTE